MEPSVVVVGSANADIVLQVERIPHAGETVLATSRADHAGGKGLNQAVAAARAGATTALLTALGHDEAGDRLAGVLAQEHGLDASLVRRVHAHTGTALIAVQSDGDNVIIVDPGAGGSLESLTATDREVLGAARVMVAQLEVPIAIVTDAARLARPAGTLVVLNAAPATLVPRELLDLVDVLVVNEHEAEVVAGVTGTRVTGASEAATALVALVPAVVLTLGAAGALVVRRGHPPVHLQAPHVEVVDTTGAGDTAVGYLAAALSRGDDLVAAARRAVLAGSASTTTRGAVPSIPRAAQVEAFARASA